jgi:hypothetical protein
VALPRSIKGVFRARTSKCIHSELTQFETKFSDVLRSVGEDIVIGSPSIEIQMPLTAPECINSLWSYSPEIRAISGVLRPQNYELPSNRRSVGKGEIIGKLIARWINFEMHDHVSSGCGTIIYHRDRKIPLHNFLCLGIDDALSVDTEQKAHKGSLHRFESFSVNSVRFARSQPEKHIHPKQSQASKSNGDFDRFFPSWGFVLAPLQTALLSWRWWKMRNDRFVHTVACLLCLSSRCTALPRCLSLFPRKRRKVAKNESRIPTRSNSEGELRAGDEVSFSGSKSYTPQKSNRPNSKLRKKPHPDENQHGTRASVPVPGSRMCADHCRPLVRCKSSRDPDSQSVENFVKPPRDPVFP